MISSKLYLFLMFFRRRFITCSLCRHLTPRAIKIYITAGVTMKKIFESAKLGQMIISNRIAMAPMTRSRALPDGTPSAITAEYYAQRATIGLIITEGVQPSADGQGYLFTPGIFSDEHVAGWKKVMSAIHTKGGHAFMQLMHAGRMSHPDNTPHHRQPVAPSAIAPNMPMFTMKGMQDIPVPRALTTEEVRDTISDFRLAARKAVESGADGVEIHGANAYLIHQFLAPSANAREDVYGGSVENRARFAIEVASAIADEIGPERTAIRLSPGLKMWGIDEGDESADLYRYLVSELNKIKLAYLHIMHVGTDSLLQELHNLWDGNFILNRPGRKREEIGKDIESGLASLESYGQMILANPDFVERIKTHSPLNEADHNSFYGGTEKGYTDYPFL